MKLWLIETLERLRASFWFVPALMVTAAAALGTAMPRLDGLIDDRRLEELGWFYGGGPEGARAVLSTVAGSVMTVAGTTFSITIAALTLASSQFGPRLLRGFVRDRGNHLVLGTFIATYLYCLLVLRTVRSGSGSELVPQISVSLAVALAVASVGVLIYFIHHVAVTIQADHLVAAVGRELLEQVDRAFPRAVPPAPAASDSGSDVGSDAESDAGSDPGSASGSDPGTDPGTDPASGPERGYALTAPEDGYLQLVDLRTLLALAARHDLRLWLAGTPGDFFVAGAPLAWVKPHLREEAVRDALRDTFGFGPNRTTHQDVRFGVDQLVEIAVRALSPGINDPFTAIGCLNRLGAALCRVAARAAAATHHVDDAGRLRIVAPVVRFEDLVDAAFDQIRQYAAGSSAVSGRLLDVLTEVAGQTRDPDRLPALLAQGEAVVRGTTLTDPEDRAKLAARLHRLRQCAERR